MASSCHNTNSQGKHMFIRSGSGGAARNSRRLASQHRGARRKEGLPAVSCSMQLSSAHITIDASIDSAGKANNLKLFEGGGKKRYKTPRSRKTRSFSREPGALPGRSAQGLGSATQRSRGGSGAVLLASPEAPRSTPEAKFWCPNTRTAPAEWDVNFLHVFPQAAHTRQAGNAGAGKFP